jgi:hypothetical protein
MRTKKIRSFSVARVSPVLFLMSLPLALAANANAETRIALVIGNSDYTVSSLKLANPANDAVTMPSRCSIRWKRQGSR